MDWTKVTKVTPPLESHKAFVELFVDGDSELEVWAALLAVFCAASGQSLKEAAAGLKKIHEPLNYRRLRGISSAKNKTAPAPKSLSHEEAIAILQYFEPVIYRLRFEGRLARVEVERRGQR